MVVNWNIYLKQLNSQNAEDDEESATDENYISDRFQGREQSLNNQLQTWSSIYHPDTRYKIQDTRYKNLISTLKLENKIVMQVIRNYIF